MGLSLSAYIEELHERADLIWPQPPAPVPLKVTPTLVPIPGIKAVCWAVYGTLLRTDQGRLLHDHPQEIRMQIALEKVIKEFNMWYSMTRKQGQPWEGLLIQYKRLMDELGMKGTKHKGDYPVIDSTQIWKKTVERLQQKEYTYDEGKYGDIDDLSTKIAYFFHASLQGAVAQDDARDTLADMTLAGIRQGLIADAQAFTLPQLMYCLQMQGKFASMSEVISAETVTLSYQQHLRKPSPSLYRTAAKNYKSLGIEPAEVLYVTHRLKDDLAAAKKVGFRTALFAADKNSCEVSASDVRDPEYKPDRLISDIKQVRQIVPF